MTRPRVAHGCQACLDAADGRCLDCREREALAQLMDVAVLAASVGDDATVERMWAIVEGHMARARGPVRVMGRVG